MAERMVSLERNTNETQIELTLDRHRVRLSEPHAGAVCPARAV